MDMGKSFKHLQCIENLQKSRFFRGPVYFLTLSNLFVVLVLASGYEDDKDLGFEFTYTGKEKYFLPNCHFGTFDPMHRF